MTDARLTAAKRLNLRKRINELRIALIRQRIDKNLKADTPAVAAARKLVARHDKVNNGIRSRVRTMVEKKLRHVERTLLWGTPENALAAVEKIEREVQDV